MIGYNRMTGYNKARYNGDGFELTFNETITTTDDTVAKTTIKPLNELIIMSGTIAKQQNKTFDDSLRINDWTRVKNDQSNKWSD